MKTFLTIITTLVFIAFSYAQQDLFPAFPNEIIYKGEIAYHNGYPFTGILVNEKTNKQIGLFQNGRKNGLFIEYSDDGIKKYEGSYVYGVKEGLHKEWFENGSKMSEINYSNGKWNGSYSEWYPNDIKKFEGTYLSGYKDGVFIDYYENGNQKSKINYTRDQLSGENQSFYSNGSLQISAMYDNGLKHGRYSEWHESGKLKKEIFYIKDQVSDGIIIEFDELGQKLHELECKRGVIYSEYSFKDGRQIVYYDYSTGFKKSEGILLKGIKEGYWTEWHSNGQKSFEGNYNNGLRAGKVVVFSTEGTVIWDGDYKEGKKHGTGILKDKLITYRGEWDMDKKNGVFVEISINNTKSEGQYVNDLKQGVWTEWFPNGKKKSEAQYTNGKIENGYYDEWYDNGHKKEEKAYLNGQLNGMHSQWYNTAGALKIKTYYQINYTVVL
jgi:uncharacterized protein